MRLIEAGRPSFFITANTHYAMLTAERPELRELNDRAAFLLADGCPAGLGLAARPDPAPRAGGGLGPGLRPLRARRPAGPAGLPARRGRGGRRGGGPAAPGRSIRG